MKRIMVAVCLMFSVSAFAEGEERPPVTPGLISLELTSGYFLNPTAGQLDEGNLSVQYCTFVGAGDGTYSLGQGAYAIYGLSDRLEVGANALIASPDPDNHSEGYGPQFRYQVAKQEGSMPQIAVGGVFLFSDIERQTLYAVATCNHHVSDDGFLQTFGLNVGVRQFWQDTPGGNVDDAVGFVGLELGLPNYLFVITEVSTKPDTAAHQPWSAGIQVRHPDGFGFTLAYAQPGGTTESSTYIGVGINFL